MLVANTSMSDDLQEDLQLVNHLIKQMDLGDKIFAFIPNTLKGISDSYTRLTNSIKEPTAKMQINHYLNAIADYNQKEKINLSYDCFNQYRTALNSGSRAFALINIKELTKQKKAILENDFFSLDYVNDYHNANYYFYVIFLLETASQVRIYSEEDLDTHSSLDFVNFIRVASLTIQSFLKMFGNKNVAVVFEYFFILFTLRFNNQENRGFPMYRTKLMEAMAFEIGGYSMNRD
ncbi:hypothetical protein [Paenibacillus naphthalenovorans]|uniref:Uncharacterized protein n=1 Tax=Paenibacillus naphthalenovorans TaxID=162209 RepID=A0A0U2UJ56_9BACL|nr:hypothetical protein [Paenibacillus naphthalenovorans]ALS23180.1 hypothetical protein IJ22_28070 [Paenibacillus naphthalenovorans]